MLEIPASIVDAMIAHAQTQAPAECCGLLAGRGSEVLRGYPLRNALNSPARYQADARDLFAAFRRMREEALDLVAIYHSHPHSTAVPSRVDLEQNYYGQVPRIIISLAEHLPVIKAFRLLDDHFEELHYCRKDE